MSVRPMWPVMGGGRVQNHPTERQEHRPDDRYGESLPDKDNTNNKHIFISTRPPAQQVSEACYPCGGQCRTIPSQW